MELLLTFFHFAFIFFILTVARKCLKRRYSKALNTFFKGWILAFKMRGGQVRGEKGTRTHHASLLGRTRGTSEIPYENSKLTKAQATLV